MADAAQARDLAAEIVAERRFSEPEVPRPFERPLDWLGDRVDAVGRWLGDRFGAIDGVLPGGSWLVWVLIGLAVAVVAVALARMYAGRAVASVARARAAADAVVDPAALERAAEAAERAGDYELAVRLRFRAGVARLERTDVLAPGGLRTTAEIGGVLDSAEFDALGTDFDAIAYGGRPAGSDDAAAARERWGAVLTR
ncbi:MAG: DUF4129 domain-containing protein [Solirubrobacteraceae bacterium]